MLERKSSVCFIAAWVDACGLWRCFFPHLNLPGSSFVCFAGQPDMKLVSGHDVVVVQRMCSEPQFNFMKIMRSIGVKIVFDLDDMLWDLPDYNPAKFIFDEHREGFRMCALAADVLSVSTERLAEGVRQYIKPLVNLWTKKEIPVVVAENKMDMRFFGPVVKSHQRDGVMVGWSGSSSHGGDLLLIQDAIQNVKKENPNVRIEFRGCHPPPPLDRMVEFKQWTPVSEFGSRMPTWGWDIGLAPLVPHPFNHAKSEIKILESAYCGVPVLASWVSPYETFCSKDKELSWLLCSNPSAWKKKLRILVNEPWTRLHYAQRAYDVLVEHYSWSNGHSGWETLLEMVRDI